MIKMTEKRFTVDDDDADIWEDNHFLAVAYNHNNAKKITERLNKLADENEKLKSEIEKLSYANEDLLEEKRIWKQMSDEYTKLSDENEHIKNTIQEAYNNERTQLGKSVLKQLMEQLQ